MFGFGRSTPRTTASPAPASSSNSTTADAPRPVRLLVIQADGDYDWKAIFDVPECRLSNGRSFQVHQCGWGDIITVAATTPADHSESNVCCDIRAPAGSRQRAFTFKPDFVLIRNEVYTPQEDHRNKLYGLMYANVGAANSLSSIAMFCERPVIQAELNRIRARLGDAAFPLVEQSYFSNGQRMMYGNVFPAVVKVGAAHAGQGKMKVQDHRVMEDVQSVLAMTDGKYCTAEPFIEADYDVRIQKIGSHYRAFKRWSVSGTWKTNTGCSQMEPIECTDEYKRWADEASRMFGGLDILSVDAIHCIQTDREYIMEVNGTSSGLGPEDEVQDNIHIRELVVAKCEALFNAPPAQPEGAAG